MNAVSGCFCLCGGTFAGSLLNALGAVAAFVPLWLLALPLLVFPPVYVAASILLNAWLNRRLLPYDALALHADEGAYEQGYKKGIDLGEVH